jgi:hypothetical protein
MIPAPVKIISQRQVKRKAIMVTIIREKKALDNCRCKLESRSRLKAPIRTNMVTAKEINKSFIIIFNQEVFNEKGPIFKAT